MSDNKTLLEKADLALNDLTAGSGLLNPEQSETFIRKMIESPNMLNENLIRFEPMRTPQKYIEKINFGKRIMRAGTSGTALATAAVSGAFDASAEATARAKPTFEGVTLTSKLTKAEVRLPYEVVEDNIERALAATNNASNTGAGGIHTTILEMIAARAILDLQELAINGDTSSADTYLAMLDGWIENISDNGNTVDVEGATISKSMLKAGLKAVPGEYKDDITQMYHFVSKNNKIEYADTLADRATGLGDRHIVTDEPAPYMGSKVMGVAKMAETEGILTNPKNLIFGIQRDVRLEFDKDITAGVYIIVLSARVDFEIEEADAAVVYSNIGSD